MTATVQFYHLTTSPLERALPKLLEKAVAGGHRVLLVEGDEAVRERLNQTLWTYSTLTFLPHGSTKENDPELQPILLGEKQADNLNKADLLVITDGTLAASDQKFVRVLDMFDGNNPASVEKARARWKHYKDAGFAPTYLRQTEQGGWEQKAAA